MDRTIGVVLALVFVASVAAVGAASPGPDSGTTPDRPSVGPTTGVATAGAPWVGPPDPLSRTRSSGFSANAQPETDTGTPPSNESICVVFFYSTGCPSCEEVATYLEESSAEYDLRVKAYRVADNPQLLRDYAERYGVPHSRRGSVPVVFVGDSHAVGSDPAIDLLSETFAEREDDGLACPAVPDRVTGAPTVAGIVGLAFVDAINPCALAVLLVLLTSILSRHPERRGRALTAGLSFAAAVFLAYYGIGLLLTAGIKSAVVVTGLSIGALYPVLGAFAVLVGVLNLKDWVSHGAGGFVMEVPFSWRPTMTDLIESATSPAGAFAVGLAVSLFLLPCTSGPYFVAGGLLAGLQWSTAIGYLLLYNAVFVLPMVAIVLAVYGGFASVDRLSDWREANVERLHLVAGVVLVALGVAMLLGLPLS